MLKGIKNILLKYIMYYYKSNKNVDRQKDLTENDIRNEKF